MKLFQVLFVFVLFGTTACIRFTPSRNEVYANQSSSGKAKDVRKDFRASENTQEQKLQKLVRDRQKYASGQDDWYRVGAGDVLKVYVFDVPELNLQARVKQSGEMMLPLIGNIQALSKTEAELQEEITEKLKKFVREPQVIVSVTNFTAKRVSVLGEVARPGIVSLRHGNYSLIEVISEAGGKTEKASGSIVLIPVNSNSTPDLTDKRAMLGTKLAQEKVQGKTEGKSRSGVEIPFDRLVGGLDQAPLEIPVLPGDTVIVPSAGVVQVDGEVKSPGSIPLGSRMTLLGVIASAGGLTYSADVNSVELIREIEPGQKSVLVVDLEKLISDVNQDIRLRDGDILRIPSHSGRFATRQVMDAINSVINFGVGGTVNMGR